MRRRQRSARASVGGGRTATQLVAVADKSLGQACGGPLIPLMGRRAYGSDGARQRGWVP